MTTDRAVERPTLGFIGIHSGGRVNQAVSQNETVAGLFAQDGYRVRRASAIRNPALRTAHQLLALLTWRDVDVIIASVFSGRSFWIAEMASRFGRCHRRRVVLFLDGGNLPVFGPEHRRWVERVFARADLIVAPSGYLAHAFAAWGYDVRVVPNVLDIGAYDYRPRRAASPNLLWMRTFHEHYNPLLAVRVLELVARKHPDACLTMGGADHGLLDATRVEAQRLGVADRISFPGYVRGKHKQAVLAENDIFLNTNNVDNMPTSVLEAGACGLVPVATAVGGIPFLIDNGVNGVVVPPGDAEAMAAAVLHLLNDPGRYERISLGARALAERSAWSVVRELWIEELSRLVPELEFRVTTSRSSEVRVNDITEDDLKEVAELHIQAFPDSILGRLGLEAVRRSYHWQLTGPHLLTALSATRNESDEMVGMLFGGVFRGSTSGFVKKEKWFLVRRVLVHPSILAQGVGRKRLVLVARLLARRASPTQMEKPSAVPEQSFGVLSIAVSPRAQGAGIGRLLMGKAADRARAAGFIRMHLTVHPTNTSAVSFYRGLGWTEVLEENGDWAGRMSFEL